LHNEELYYFYSSLNITIIITLRRRKYENTHKSFIGKPERKKPFGRPSLTCVVNIRMDLRKILCVGVDWTHLAQDRIQWQALVKTVMNPWVP
jgi:hypothetical protein